MIEWHAELVIRAAVVTIAVGLAVFVVARILLLVLSSQGAPIGLVWLLMVGEVTVVTGAVLSAVATYGQRRVLAILGLVLSALPLFWLGLALVLTLAAVTDPNGSIPLGVLTGLVVLGAALAVGGCLPRRGGE